MRSAPSGQFRVRCRRPPVTALATALLLVTGLMGTAVGQTLGAAPAAAGAATAQVSAVGEGNVVTPGDFTGYGFDQCHAPDQRSMNKWLTYSPFLAVGIYISGNSRACRDQPNLTPEWISTQLAKGWRLLPITLGPQASCQPRFPRYQDDPKINPKRGTDGLYQWARAQGTAEATKTVTDAQALGIVPGSTLWYDLEGFDDGLTDCRESALCVPLDLDRPAARPRLQVRRLLQRRLGHRDARRRARRASRPVQPAGRDLDRPLGPPGQHLHVVHPRRRLAAGRPDEAVPGRPRRDLGRRPHQHRPQLPRPRPRLVRHPRDALRGHPHQLLALPGGQPGRREQGRPGPPVPAEGEGRVRRPDLRHVRRGDRRRRPGLDGLDGPSARSRSSPRGTGSRC